MLCHNVESDIESQEYARNVFRSHILKTKLMNIMPRFYGMEDFCRNKVGRIFYEYAQGV